MTALSIGKWPGWLPNSGIGGGFRAKMAGESLGFHARVVLGRQSDWEFQEPSPVDRARHLDALWQNRKKKKMCGMLFREYCFGRESSLSYAANLVSSAKNWVSSHWHTNKKG